MTLLPLINHALELEKRYQISISLAPCISQCNIFLILGVSLMRRAFNASYINSLCATNFEGYMNRRCGTGREYDSKGSSIPLGLRPWSERFCNHGNQIPDE
jgi:hypothetical protein